jgi:hypothetical protein
VPTIEPRQIAYIGLRDIDDDERKILRHMVRALRMSASVAAQRSRSAAEVEGNAREHHAHGGRRGHRLCRAQSP